MKGWKYDSYRHSLAARGIRTSYAMKRPLRYNLEAKDEADILEWGSQFEKPEVRSIKVGSRVFPLSDLSEEDRAAIVNWADQFQKSKPQTSEEAIKSMEQLQSKVNIAGKSLSEFTPVSEVDLLMPDRDSVGVTTFQPTAMVEYPEEGQKYSVGPVRVQRRRASVRKDKSTSPSVVVVQSDTDRQPIISSSPYELEEDKRRYLDALKYEREDRALREALLEDLRLQDNIRRKRRDLDEWNSERYWNPNSGGSPFDGQSGEWQ